MQTFTTPAPVTAILDVPAGRIHLIASDRGDTTVDVRPAEASKGRDAKAAEQTAVEYADGVLRIVAPAKQSALVGAGAVEVTVHLPAGSRVEARAEAAGLRAVGRLGEVVFDGAYGEPRAVEVDEVASLRLTGHAGDVEVGRLDGPAEIDIQKGDIRIAEAVRGTVVLRTRAGNVTVGAARGVAASLDAGTTYGRVRNALQNAGGTAELSIHATTAHGDVDARSL